MQGNYTMECTKNNHLILEKLYKSLLSSKTTPKLLTKEIVTRMEYAYKFLNGVK